MEETPTANRRMAAKDCMHVRNLFYYDRTMVAVEELDVNWEIVQ